MDARCEEALEVQSILFQRDKWTLYEALTWIEENPEFTAEKVDLTEDYIRIRQHDPDLFDKTSFRTITFSERKGIKAITACPRGNYRHRRANPRRRIPIKVAADAYVGTDTAMIVVIAPERLSELREWPHSSADWSEYEAFEESVKAAGGDIIYTGADGEWGVELMFPNRYHNPRRHVSLPRALYGDNRRYVLKQYERLSDDGLPQYGVQFGEVAKWGINVETQYFPKGVYFYYLAPDCRAALGGGFATERRYANVAKLALSKLAIQYDGHPKGFSEQDYARAEKYLKRRYGMELPPEPTLLNLILALADEFGHSKFNRVFKDLGYSGILDVDGAILPVESCQGVITWPDGAKYIESLEKPTREHPVPITLSGLTPNGLAAFNLRKKGEFIPVNEEELEEIIQHALSFDAWDWDHALDYLTNAASVIDFERSPSWVRGELAATARVVTDRINRSYITLLYEDTLENPYLTLFYEDMLKNPTYRRSNPPFTKDTFLDPSQGGVNMSVVELRAWARDPRHKLASTAVGHYSLTRIPELVQKPERNWTEDDYEWAQKVVDFNWRHLQQVVKAHEERGGKGGFGREVGRSGYSKRHIALLNWGHDPGKEDSPAYEADIEWQDEDE